MAGNAPMKSSAQRQIRAKVLEQIPFLSHPAAAPPPAAAPTPAQQPTEATHDSDEEEADSARRKKGAGKDKRAGKAAGGKSGKGGGKKGGNKRGGGDDADEEATSLPAQPPLGGEDQEDEALTVLDLIWPKKETLSLVKWCVSFRRGRNFQRGES